MRNLIIAYSPADAGSSAHTESKSDAWRPGNGTAHGADEHILRTLAEFDFWEGLGFGGELIPLEPGDKRLYERNWSKREWPVEEVRKKVERGSNVGLRLSRWGVLDVEETPLGDLFLTALRKRFPDAPMRSRAGSRSKALLVAVEGPVGEWQVIDALMADGAPVLDDKGRQKTRCLVELLTGSGAQLHILGHRADCDGVRLEWEGETAAPFLPVVSESELLEIRDEMAQIAIDAGCVDVQASTPRPRHTGGASTGGATTSGEYPPHQWVESKILIEAIGCIENDKEWCNLDTWMGLAFAFGRLCGGAEDVEKAFFKWSHRPAIAKDEKTFGLFRDAREGRVETPGGAAAGIVAGALRKHPAKGCVKRAEELAEAITNAVDVERFPDMEGAPGGSGGEGEGSTPPKPSEALAAKINDAFRRLRAALDEVGQDIYCASGGRDRLAPIGPEILSDVPYVPASIDSRFEKGKAHAIFSPGGLGKSSLLDLEILAHITNRPELVGEVEFDWPGVCVLVNNEDGFAAVCRRLAAMGRYFGMKESDIPSHRIFVHQGDPMTFVETTREGVRLTEKALEFIEMLIEVRRDHGPIAHICLDTLDSIAGNANTSSRDGVADLMGFIQRLAESAFASVIVSAHKRKSTSGPAFGAGGAEDLAGSAAIGNRFRHVIELSPLSTDEITKFNLQPSEASRFVRSQGVKRNGLKPATRRYYEHASMQTIMKDARRPDDFILRPVDFLRIAEGLIDTLLERALKILATAIAQAVDPKNRIKLGALTAKPGRPADNTVQRVFTDGLGMKSADARELTSRLMREHWIETYRDGNGHGADHDFVRLTAKGQKFLHDLEAVGGEGFDA